MPIPEIASNKNELVILPEGGGWSQYYYRGSFYDAGIDSYTNPPVQPQSAFLSLSNVLPTTKGTLDRRWGYGQFATTTVPTIRAMGSYFDTQTNKRYWLGSGFNGSIPQLALINEDATGDAAVLSGTSSGKLIRWAISRGRLFLTDGGALAAQWIGNPAIGPVPWGLPDPTQAPTAVPGASGTGSIKLNVGRTYCVAWVESLTGTVSTISPLSTTTGPLDGTQNVTVTVPAMPTINPPTPMQLDHLERWLLATADGNDPTTLYLLADITGTPNTVTLYVDNTPDSQLLTLPVVLEFDAAGNPHGILFNSPPPQGLGLLLQHNGRVFGAKNTLLYYSKAIDEVTTGSGNITSAWEAAWPPANVMDISTGGDIIRALISYNGVLYLGTHQKIYSIIGDSPTNFTAPQLVFQDVGMIGQEAVTPVFLQGQPIGFVWITPDLRVLLSDFNTYVEIGKAIYNDLKQVVPTDLSTITVSYFGQGPYDLCIINIPSPGNTMFVYDLRNQRWFKWTLGFDALAYGIQTNGTPILLAPVGGVLYSMGPQWTSDLGQNITATIESVWLDFGDPATRKIFNEVDLTTDDPSLQFSLYGASIKDGFNVIHNIAVNVTPVLGPLNTYKVYLSGNTMRDQFYKYRIVSTGAGGSPILRAIRFEVIPINRI